ncbi:MAG: hypothetical protein PVF45_12925 [Anaerolineae bacterium]|jgi:hypothetical protein
MSALTFYLKVLRALEDIKAPYMIVGAFAGLAFGVNRTTFDIDILVDLRESDFEALAARFPLPRYYADPKMMRDSTRMGIMFNLIDTTEGVKADLVPLTREPAYRAAFARRVRHTFQDDTGQVFEAWCAQPTDIIIGKLRAWAEGHSAKHPADIHAMLVFAFGDLGTEPIDLQAIALEAARLGPEVVTLWEMLINRAKEQVRRHQGAS